MPSLIFMSYLVANEENKYSPQLIVHQADDLVNRKFCIGHVGFSDSTEYMKNLKQGHGEKWDLISHFHQIELIIQERNKVSYVETMDSIEGLAEKLISEGNIDNASEKDPSDYVSRLELWDTHAIEVGESKPLAIATWLEHEVERQTIAQQMQAEGINGEIFNLFLLRQLSWPLKKEEPPLDMEATRQKWQEMPSERK